MYFCIQIIYFQEIITMDSLFRKIDDRLECLLCPRYCKLTKGKTGICGVRKNTGEKIELLTYGVISGYALDPIEKKPLYHFFPGNNILSIGSYGCNMRCDFCQNWHISQKKIDSFRAEIKPDQLLKEAIHAYKNIGLAFTYNEPLIWFEFIKDMALLIRQAGLCTAMVSNGYINKGPLNELIQLIDAFNIDLKAFNNDFYKRLTGADLEPVKNTLKQIAKSGRHLEITTLIIPGRNDDENEMAHESEWIAGELGKATPFHLSRYFPMYKRNDPATPRETLERLSETASKYLDYVYIGNTVSEKGQNTKCSKCGTIVTTRSGYNTRTMNLDSEGRCKVCKTLIYEYFTFSASTEH